MNIAKNTASWIVQLWWSWNGKHVGRFIGSTYHRVQWELPRYDSKRSNPFLDQLMIQWWWWYPNTSHLHAIIAWSLTNYERHWSEMRSPTNQRSWKDSPFLEENKGKHMNPAPRFPEDSAQTKESQWKPSECGGWKKNRGKAWHGIAARKIWRWLVTPPYDSTSVWRFSITKKRCQFWMTKQESARLAAQCPDQWQPKLSAIFSHLQATAPSWQRSEIPEAWSTPGHRRIAKHQLEWFHAQWE